MAEKDNLPDKGNQMPVDIIASGYEWNCHVCGELNKEIEYLELVTCFQCDESFKTNVPEHCFG